MFGLFGHRKLHLAAALLSAAALAMPVAVRAQFSESYDFLKAVRDRDGTKATDALNKPGTTIANTRDSTTGETALHIVIARRDAVWVSFLAQKGANPNLRDNRGQTPLMLAVTLRYLDGVEALIARGARVDEPNNSGETPLIRAVQLRDLPTVRALLKAGADPRRTDSAAGLSARDYAAQDGRASAILSEIDSAIATRANTPRTATYGPTH